MKHWTKEEKREFLAAYESHLGHGATKRAAYAMAKIDFQRAGKLSPAFSTFERWIYVDGVKAAPTEAEPETEPEVEAEAAEPVTEPEEPAGTERRTRLLELVVKLYRTKWESAIDELCDELFPELTEAEK